MNRSRRFCITSGVFLAAACAPTAGTTAGATRGEPAYYPMTGRPDLPFSEAVRFGPFLFLSGQIGTDSTNARLVAGGIGPETAQAIANLRAVLERHGSSLSRVIKCTVILADLKEWGAMNAVYAPLFAGHLPARTAIGGASLVMGARVELDCVAAAGPV